MKELCIPVPGLGDSDQAEIILSVGGKQKIFNYRLVSFPWDMDEDRDNYKDELSLSLARIHRLKTAIENYDKDWELIQIFNPAEDVKYIQVLYRKKTGVFSEKSHSLAE